MFIADLFRIRIAAASNWSAIDGGGL